MNGQTMVFVVFLHEDAIRIMLGMMHELLISRSALKKYNNQISFLLEFAHFLQGEFDLGEYVH